MYNSYRGKSRSRDDFLVVCLVVLSILLAVLIAVFIAVKASDGKDPSADPGESSSDVGVQGPAESGSTGESQGKDDPDPVTLPS